MHFYFFHFLQVKPHIIFHSIHLIMPDFWLRFHCHLHLIYKWFVSFLFTSQHIFVRPESSELLTECNVCRLFVLSIASNLSNGWLTANKIAYCFFLWYLNAILLSFNYRYFLRSSHIHLYFYSIHICELLFRCTWLLFCLLISTYSSIVNL